MEGRKAADGGAASGSREESCIWHGQPQLDQSRKIKLGWEIFGEFFLDFFLGGVGHVESLVGTNPMIHTIDEITFLKM